MFKEGAAVAGFIQTLAATLQRGEGSARGGKSSLPAAVLAPSIDASRTASLAPSIEASPTDFHEVAKEASDDRTAVEQRRDRRLLGQNFLGHRGGLACGFNRAVAVVTSR
jgi:hypothetical protein